MKFIPKLKIVTKNCTHVKIKTNTTLLSLLSSQDLQHAPCFFQKVNEKMIKQLQENIAINVLIFT